VRASGEVFNGNNMEEVIKMGDLEKTVDKRDFKPPGDIIIVWEVIIIKIGVLIAERKGTGPVSVLSREGAIFVGIQGI
jgi:hypothetical protein